MKPISDIAVVIQARLGSKRIPQKMIKEFAGTTLTDIFLDKIKKCTSFPINNFYLSVYEPELREIGNKHGVNIFSRSEDSANSEGTPMWLMYEWWDKLPHKYVVLVNACVPFLKPETIDSFVEEYLQTEADGLFGVMKKKNYFWNKDLSMVTPWPEGQAVMNTKFVETTFEAAHCLYAGRLEKIGHSIWMGDFNTPGDIQLFSMNEEECLDIDYEWQFNMCEKLYISGVR